MRPIASRFLPAVSFALAAACSSSGSTPSADATDAANVPATTAAASPTATATTVAARATVPADSVLVVYKTPTCGCCKAWVERMKESGFAVEVHDVPDLTALKSDAGIPEELQACHTARIGGYVVEGHVPAADIRRLLAERPAVTGIATPGMPMGSPGMEGGYKDHYDVMTFGGSGKQTVFASH